MPQVRKLTMDEVRTIEGRIKGQRKLIEEEYDGILGDYALGEYGEATLGDEENRITVRNRLKAAATRRGVTLDFRRTKGNQLRFKVLLAGSSTTDDEEEDLPEAPTVNTGAKGRGRSKKSPN